MRIAAAAGMLLVLLLASCSHSSSIVGKWKTTDEVGMTWEFADNGAVTQGTDHGRYSLGADNRVKIETPHGTSVYQMQMNGDELTLTDARGAKLHFKRIAKETH